MSHPAPKFAVRALIGVVSVYLCFMTLLLHGQGGRSYHIDEGIELMKALLWVQGEPLYGAMWNDQPPLHALLLGTAFKWLGPTVETGRGLALGFSVLLVGTLAGVVTRRHGWPTGVMAVLFALSFPTVLMQGGAVLMSLPAYALACGAVWLAMGKGCDRLFGRKDSKNTEESLGMGAEVRFAPPVMIAVGGLVFGLAMQTKFTALLLLPPLGIHWWLTRGEAGFRGVAQRLGLFAVGAVMGWVGVQGFAPGESLTELLRLHFDVSVREAFAGDAKYMTLDAALLGLWPTMVLAGVGAVALLRRRAWELMFPLWMLGTAYLAHRLHRPFWDYYLLHFAVPAGWLAAVGSTALVRWLAFREPARGGIGAPRVLAGLAASVILGTAVVQTVGGWVTGVGDLRPRTDWTMSELEDWLATQRPAPRWVLTDRPFVAFRLGLAVPPEVCVLSKKRVLAGRLPTSELIRMMMERQPELVALPRGLLSGMEWNNYLARQYQPVQAIGQWQCHRRQVAALTEKGG